MSNLIQLPVIAPSVPTLDNSSMDTFNKCPYLYSLSVVRAKKPAFASTALDWGTLFHLGLAVWYKTFDAREALNAILEADFEDRPDDFRTKSRAMLMLAEYIEYYNIDPQWEILFTETAFDVRDEKGLRWGGRLDLMVKWNDRIWIVDHKTTSRFGATYFDPFVPDTQMVGYGWAGSILHGQPVYGVIINAIVVHKVKKPAEEQFKRKPLPFKPWMFEEWEDQTIRSYEEIERAHQEGHFRRRWRSCVEKYGRCSAYDLCRVSPENRERVISSEYIDNTWDWRAEDAD